MDGKAKRTLFCWIGAFLLPWPVVLAALFTAKIDLLGSSAGANVIFAAIGLSALPLLFLPTSLERRFLTAFCYAVGVFYCVWFFSMPLGYRRLAEERASRSKDRGGVRHAGGGDSRLWNAL